MNVYAVVSELLHTISYDPPDEDYGCIAVIVAAKTRGQARYLAAKSDSGIKGYDPIDWPKLYTKKVGEADISAGIVLYPDDMEWWEKTGDWNPGAIGDSTPVEKI